MIDRSHWYGSNVAILPGYSDRGESHDGVETCELVQYADNLGGKCCDGKDAYLQFVSDSVAVSPTT